MKKGNWVGPVAIGLALGLLLVLGILAHEENIRNEVKRVPKSHITDYGVLTVDTIKRTRNYATLVCNTMGDYALQLWDSQWIKLGSDNAYYIVKKLGNDSLYNSVPSYYLAQKYGWADITWVPHFRYRKVYYKSDEWHLSNQYYHSEPYWHPSFGGVWKMTKAVPIATDLENREIWHELDLVVKTKLQWDSAIDQKFIDDSIALLRSQFKPCKF